MEIKTLSGSIRTETGKRTSRSIRHRGRVPAVMYGGGKNVALEIDEREFNKAVPKDRRNVVLDLKVSDGEGGRKVMVKEVQRHPITQSIVHVDFQEISMDKPIRMEVPLTFTGEPVGVKMKGGQVHVHLRELLIECLPTDLVDQIQVDIGPLDLGQVWHVKDLPVSEKIRFLEDPGKTVVSVAQPKAVEEEKPAAEGEPAPAEGAVAPTAAAEPRKEEKTG
jgi:large subunit ribosomal protein L25